MVHREFYLEKIRPFVGTDVVKVVTGLRRSGKSVLLEQMRDELLARSKGTKVVYLDFEDQANAALLDGAELHRRLASEIDGANGAPVAVFLDEISDVEGWETAVNSIRKKPNADLYLTGSNSKLLSGELATHLTGRFVEIGIAPFSFSEFREAAAPLFPDRDDASLFDLYLERGGLPFLAKVGYDAEASRQYLGDLFWAILSKDVVRRKEIRDVDLLERVVRFAFAESGHPFSARSVVRFLKSERRSTTAETVLNHLGACGEAFLLQRVDREDLPGKRLLSVDEKYYAADHGLRRAVVGGNAGADVDQVLEGVVLRELVRRGWRTTVGRLGDREIDFVCERAGERRYVQVAYLMPTPETREREFGSLEAIGDQWPKLVLSLDRRDMGRNGVRHRYLPDFLLDPDSI